LSGCPFNFPGFFKIEEKTLKNRVLTAAVMMSLLSSVALADTYRAEAGLSYDYSDADNAPATTDTYTLAGSVYFKPVDDSKGPRAEAAFLSRSSSVSASYSDSDKVLLDKSYSASTRVVLGNGTTLQAGYTNLNDFYKVYSVAVGTYLNDHSDVSVKYSSTDGANSLFAERSYGANYHSVLKLAGTTSVAYNVGASYLDLANTQNGYKVDVDATYYFNQNLGLGALASYSDRDAYSTSTVGLQASYFVTPNFFVNGYAKTTDFDGPNEDSYGVGASVRF
jgi:hypothetical protein